MPDHPTHSKTLVGPKNFKNLVSSSASTSTCLSSVQQCAMAQGSKEPWVQIVEEPMSKGQRFRYKCEGRSAGSLPGQTSTVEKKTFPTILIHNFDGNAAIVVVSCVTKDQPHRPHPHNLVGQDCKEGVCTLRVKGPGPIVFSNIGIQCCKRHDVVESLQTRAKIRVDPFATGIPEDTNTIDLNAVRLCFQVFLPDVHKKFTRVVKPVISQPIIDKKTIHDLVICRLSRQSGYAQGGDEVFLLCEKVNKDDIQVRFYQETEDGVCWEAYGEFTAQDIHRQYAIVFRTPPYRDADIQTTVQVFIQLRRPSDDEVGDPKPFQYIPNDPDPYGIASKRKRFSASSPSHIPTSVLADIKGDSDTSQDPVFSQSVKMKLKRKAERGLLKKEKMTPPVSMMATKIETNLPEYSFVNTGGIYQTAPITFATNPTSTGTFVYDMGQSGAVVTNENVMSFLSMLGMTDGQVPQLTLTPINASTGQVIDGNFTEYVQYTTDNPTHLSTDSFVISSLPEMDGMRDMDVVAGDGTVGAEECVVDSKPASDAEMK